MCPPAGLAAIWTRTQRVPLMPDSLDILKLAEDPIGKILYFFDGQTLQSQLDLLENCDKFKNVVILQSAVEVIQQK